VYARTNRSYNERGSRTNYVHSSTPHCTSICPCQFPSTSAPYISFIYLSLLYTINNSQYHCKITLPSLAVCKFYTMSPPTYEVQDINHLRTGKQDCQESDRFDLATWTMHSYTVNKRPTDVSKYPCIGISSHSYMFQRIRGAILRELSMSLLNCSSSSSVWGRRFPTECNAAERDEGCIQPSSRSAFMTLSNNSASSFGGLVVSMLASGTRVCRLKPGRSNQIFRVKKSSACPPSEGK
jgi:hypothetical protein